MNKLLLLLLPIFLVISVDDAYSVNWFEDYQFSRLISIDSNDFDSDLTDYPIYINVTGFAPDIDVGVDTVTSCYDFAFTDITNTTQYPHEVERCNNSSNEIEIWVKVPTVSSSSDTEMIMYYGDTSKSYYTATASDVWASHFKMVHHMNDTKDPSDCTVVTSTQNTDINGQPPDLRCGSGMSKVNIVNPGQMGRGISVDGVSDGLATLYDPKDADQPFSSGGSISFWWLQESAPDGWSDFQKFWLETNELFDQHDDDGSTLSTQFVFDYVSGEYNLFKRFTTTNGNWSTNTSPEIYFDKWYYTVLTYDESSASNDPIIYHNGTSLTITEDSTPLGSPYVISVGHAPQQVGIENRVTIKDSSDIWIDEFRITTNTLSADWVASDFECQKGTLHTDNCISSFGAENNIPVSISPRFFESDGTTIVDDGTILQENSTGSRTISVNATGYATFTGLSGFQNFTFITNQDIHVNKTINFDATATSSFDSSTFIHRVNCPSNGSGDDLVISVNASQYSDGNDSHYTTSQTTPSCAVGDNVSWSTVQTPTGSNTGQVTSLISVEILALDEFGSNPDLFQINSTTIPTSYSEPYITSISNVTGQHGDALVLSNFLSLILPTPPETPPGEGSGSSSSGSFTGTTNLVSIEVTQPTIPNLLFGENGTVILSIVWDEPENLIIKDIELINESPLVFDFPDFPIELKGNPEVTSVNSKFSSQNVELNVIVPQKCNPEITRTNGDCVDSKLFKIPAKVIVTIASIPDSKNISIFINIQNELFLPFVALASIAGIVFIGIVGRTVYQSKRSKKNDYVLSKLKNIK